MSETFQAGPDDNLAPAPGISPEADPKPVVTAAPFELKAGDRTFNTAQDAASHIDHAQGHIKNLEEENRLLREKTGVLETKVGEIDTVKEQMTALLEEVQKNQQGDSSSQTGATDVNELVNKVKQSISADAVVTTESQNWADSKAAAVKLWGDDYLNKISQKADELGVPVTELDRMAHKTPGLFKQTVLGIAPPKVSDRTSVTDSSVNTNAFNQQKPDEKKVSHVKMNSKDRSSDVAGRIAAYQNQP